MARTQAVYYRDSAGVEPVDAFIRGLPSSAAAKVLEFVDEYLNGRLETAPPPEFPISSQVAGELRELRIRFGRVRYRVLYQRSGNLIVLLQAIEKHTGAIPRADIDVANQRMADFSSRMNAKPRVPPRAAGHDAPRSPRRRP